MVKEEGEEEAEVLQQMAGLKGWKMTSVNFYIHASFSPSTCQPGTGGTGGMVVGMGPDTSPAASGGGFVVSGCVGVASCCVNVASGCVGVASGCAGVTSGLGGVGAPTESTVIKISSSSMKRAQTPVLGIQVRMSPGLQRARAD